PAGLQAGRRPRTPSPNIASKPSTLYLVGEPNDPVGRAVSLTTAREFWQRRPRGIYQGRRRRSLILRRGAVTCHECDAYGVATRAVRSSTTSQNIAAIHGIVGHAAAVNP